ncbi:MAG TPA: DnaB-like helicase C-terminal domain-containing protein [Candidatus Acidoferrales bacterium]|nr:DnaB-like helicase C-terminal domain-containing protein [Candidatus Acidoferrales bacterium]
MDQTFAKKLPHNLDAERSVLGAAILDSNAILRVLAVLRDAHFFLPQNRIIYRAMEILSATGKPIDTVALLEVLGSSSQLELAGGVSYLSSLADGLPRATNIEHYADIVVAKAHLRELIHFGERLQHRAWECADLPEKLTEDAIAELLNITSNRTDAIRARPWNEVAQSAVDQLASAKLNPAKAARMFFGLADLDEMTSGLRRKELCLIVAPTSHGKTLLASQLATSVSRKGFRILYFSAEMPGEQLTLREIAYRARVKFYFIQRPETLSAVELERLSDAALEPTEIQIVDQDITPSRIWAMAEAAKRTGGLDLVVVDYDQLVIEAGIDPKADDDSVFRHQRSFMLAAKRLAERLDVCVVLLCQLRKVSASIAKGAHPRLDDIWGDSSVRNTPHLILWLVRRFFQRNMDIAFERKACVYVLKARNGRTGIVNLDFDPERVRFLNVSVEDTERQQLDLTMR